MNFRELQIFLKTKSLFKNYWGDFVIFIISIVSFYLLLRYFDRIFPILNSSFLPFVSAYIKFIVWIFYFLLLRILLLCIINNLELILNPDYLFSTSDLETKWIFQGGPRALTNPDRLWINSSNSGCLLKKRFKNFEMKFEAKLLQAKKLGLILRAQDLANYYMLNIQICNEKPLQIQVLPHVRFNGNFEAFNANYSQIIPGIDPNNFISFKLIANNEKILLYADDKLCCDWILPTHVEYNVEQHPSTNDTEAVPEVYFRLSFGMIGFRCHPSNEEAQIKNITIHGKI